MNPRAAIVELVHQYTGQHSAHLPSDDKTQERGHGEDYAQDLRADAEPSYRPPHTGHPVVKAGTSVVRNRPAGLVGHD